MYHKEIELTEIKMKRYLSKAKKQQCICRIEKVLMGNLLEMSI